jgi:hypothetical protein
MATVYQRRDVRAPEVKNLPPDPFQPNTTILPRVIVQIEARDQALIDWESLDAGGRIVVRSSPVCPRVLQDPMTFPIRVLEVDGTPSVRNAIESTFHGTARGNAFIDAYTTLLDVESFAKRESWATIEILHVHDLAAGDDLLSNAHESAPGTAGWFLRLADRFQIRLIVLDRYKPEHRLLAQTIIDRGGPAVFFLPGDGNRLYAEIAHDRPLDWIRGEIPGSVLFVGAGGEEALRYSSLAQGLSEVKDAYVREIASAPKMAPRQSIDRGAIKSAIIESAEEMGIVHDDDIHLGDLYDHYGTRAQRFGHLLAAKLPKHGVVAIDLGLRIERMRNEGTSVLTVDDLAETVASSSKPLRSIDPKIVFSDKLDDIVNSAANYYYEDHESDGMLPLAAKVDDARSLVTAMPGRKKKIAAGPRYVNSAFYKPGSNGKLEEIPQANARLRSGEIVHLGVEIAAKNVRIVTLGSTRFLEEKIKWEEDGAWMEIGVTGIDFDVIGDPVQEFWLPRDEPSDLIAFAVRPFEPATVPGVARLRFTIYHRDNVVQSFFVAAALESAPPDVAAEMARALSVPPSDAKKIGKAGYIARLEYSTTTSIADGAKASPRGLTIVANDSAGDKVTTIKGNDLFRVGKSDNSAIVAAARSTLEAASRRGVAYRYNFQNTSNAGDPKELEDVLPEIALAGWRIYNDLVPDPDDQDNIRSLIEKGEGIHAAHLDFSNVIPWSMVYDREVFFDRKNAPPAVCRASMPDAKGDMPKVECGSATCLLSQGTYDEERVICPRRFWGFMFPIDVPAQKIEKIDEKATGLVEEIKAGNPLTVVAGYNSNLTFAAAHVKTLTDGLLKNAKVASGTGRVPVRTLVKKNDPDIAYFYCHGLSKTVAKNGTDFGSTLDFGLGFKGNIDDVLYPADFGGKPPWTHAPLVFINGCSTAGFSPYAPSEFIKQFIRAKHAAAVVGTETTIVETLAVEVAIAFLDVLLQGKSAGEAMLRMRRVLLAKNNPLGLMYTLYGSSRLRLATA